MFEPSRKPCLGGMLPSCLRFKPLDANNFYGPLTLSEKATDLPDPYYVAS